MDGNYGVLSNSRKPDTMTQYLNQYPIRYKKHFKLRKPLVDNEINRYVADIKVNQHFFFRNIGFDNGLKRKSIFLLSTDIHCQLVSDSHQYL